MRESTLQTLLKTDFYVCFPEYLTPSHIETSPLIYSANQWTGFYMIGTSFMKELHAFFL